jgi:hypothetical protein
VKQPDTWSCMAAVACMATETTLEEFIEFVGHDGSSFSEESKHPEKRLGFSWKEISLYMLQHDIVPGYGVNVDPDTVYEKGEPYIEIGVLDLRGLKSILTIESEKFEGGTHVVYWDGEMVHDPNPQVKDGRPIGSYRLTSVWPICTV